MQLNNGKELLLTQFLAAYSIWSFLAETGCYAIHGFSEETGDYAILGIAGIRYITYRQAHHVLSPVLLFNSRGEIAASLHSSQRHNELARRRHCERSEAISSCVFRIKPYPVTLIRTLSRLPRLLFNLRALTRPLSGLFYMRSLIIPLPESAFPRPAFFPRTRPAAPGQTASLCRGAIPVPLVRLPALRGKR